MTWLGIAREKIELAAKDISLPRAIAAAHTHQIVMAKVVVLACVAVLGLAAGLAYYILVIERQKKRPQQPTTPAPTTPAPPSATEEEVSNSNKTIAYLT